ncbi:MAG: hypothetical protein ABI655_13120 [Phenylobacterium sp.]
MADTEARRGAGHWAIRVGSLFVALLGVLLLVGGAWLASLGGSSYYLLAGAGLLATGGLLVVRRPLGGVVYGVVLLATLAWGLWEAGLVFWPLVPRIFAPAVVGLLVMLLLLGAPRGRRRTQGFALVGAGVVLSLAVLGAALPRTFSGWAGHPGSPMRCPR